MVDLIQNVVTGIVAAVVTMLVGYYLGLGREPDWVGEEVAPPVLHPFRSRSSGYSVALSLVLVLAASLVVALVAGACVAMTTEGLRGPREILSFSNENAWSQLSWAFWNYLVWGALSWFLVAFARHTLTPDPKVFATAGLLGGFHHIMANLGIHFIGRLVLSDSTVAELYALQPRALVRMWLPFFLESISGGVLLAYYLTITSNRPFARGLYRLRYKILMVFVVVLALNYPAVLAVEEGSFVRTALTYQNTGIVWWGCLGAGVCGLALGSALYDFVLKRGLETHSQEGSSALDSAPQFSQSSSEPIEAAPREEGADYHQTPLSARRGHQRGRQNLTRTGERGGRLAGLILLSASLAALVGAVVALMVERLYALGRRVKGKERSG